MSKAAKKPLVKRSKPAATRGKTAGPVPGTASHVVLPGYLHFSRNVFTLLRDNFSVIWKLVVLGWVCSLLIFGATQIGQYADLSHSTDQVTGSLSSGFYKSSVEVGALLISLISGSLTSGLSEGQQIYSALLSLFMWVVTIWLLRHMLAGTKVRLRDGLYNAGAPLIPIVMLLFVGLLQLIPFALGVTALSSLIVSGVLSNVFVIILAVIIVLLLAAISLYWLVGTGFAAIIATIPGTYPRVALRSAKELIAGYRVSVLFRVLWLGVASLLAVCLIAILLISIDMLSGYRLAWLVAPLYQLLTVTVGVYCVTYTYVLYRRIIDERS